MIKKISIGASIAIIIIACIFYFMWDAPTNNVTNEIPAFTLTADTLYNHYQINETEANKKYLAKVIQVSGLVNEIQKDPKGNFVFILKSRPDEIFGVTCSVDSTSVDANGIKPGDTISIKGICTGGGEMSDVMLDKCVIVQ